MALFASRKNSLICALAALAASLLLFERSDLDFWLQDRFYSPKEGTWVLAKEAKLPRMLFYHGPKVLLIALGSWLLLSLLAPKRWKGRRFVAPLTLRESVYLMACLGLFPACISAAKKSTGHHCPSELKRYGGKHEFRKIFTATPKDSEEMGRCFPAGHASGGFALLGLFHVAQDDRRRKAAVALGLGAGWCMGLYQMLTGAHFLSHTVVTMLLAWIFTTALAMLLQLPTSGRDSSKS